MTKTCLKNKDNRMKIAFVSDSIYPYNKGGKGDKVL